MFERCTRPAREVVSSARQEAHGLRHHYVGTEHLLLGLLAQPTGVATEVLRAAGLEHSAVRAQVVCLVGAGTDGLGTDEAEALSAIGIDLQEVRARMEDSFGPGILDSAGAPSAVGRTPGTRWTRRAKKSLELALREARHLHHDSLGPEHILLGLIHEAHGVAGRVLAAHQPLPTLRQRLLDELDQAA